MEYARVVKGEYEGETVEIGRVDFNEGYPVLKCYLDTGEYVFLPIDELELED